MEYIDFFKQLFTIAFGGFAALVLTFYIIWPKIENHLLKLNNINQSKLLTKDHLQLRFAAYERLILLVHRISPNQVLLRTYNNQLTVDSLKSAILNDIENEYQHNFTQQLYVSDVAWQVVKDLKENTVSLIKNAHIGLGSHANIDEYISTIMKHISTLEVNPYDAAQIILKKELSA